MSCGLQGQTVTCTQLASYIALHDNYLFTAACPSESLDSPTEHNSLRETHLLSDSHFSSSLSKRQQFLPIERLTMNQKKYCLFGFTKGPSSVSLHTAAPLPWPPGLCCIFPGISITTELQGRNRVGDLWTDCKTNPFGVPRLPSDAKADSMLN